MKFPVLKKGHKILYAALGVMLLSFAVMLSVILLVADVYQESGPVLVVMLAVYLILFLVGAALMIVSAFSSVTVDENGVSLYFGSIRLNLIKWTDVKRVEVVFAGFNLWIINVMTTDKPSFSFRRARMVENTNKKRITFLYNSDALGNIRQHYDGEVINPSPM